jgi:hypothetical protein
MEQKGRRRRGPFRSLSAGARIRHGRQNEDRTGSARSYYLRLPALIMWLWMFLTSVSLICGLASWLYRAPFFCRMGSRGRTLPRGHCPRRTGLDMCESMAAGSKRQRRTFPAARSLDLETISDRLEAAHTSDRRYPAPRCRRRARPVSAPDSSGSRRSRRHSHTRESSGSGCAASSRERGLPPTFRSPD